MGDGELRFDDNLYEGTASFYDRFRPPYPIELLDELRSRVPLGPDARVVDLACGTGQIAFGLAETVGEVWAVDQEREFIDLGRDKAKRLGLGNIRWVVSTAEDVELVGTFDLVAIGNAFHRLDRRAVSDRLSSGLVVGGCVALLWSWSPWRGERPWQKALEEMIERWLDRVDARHRVPSDWETEMRRTPHRDILRLAGLDYEGRIEVPVVERWTPESLLGNIYSSSHLNQGVLGDHAAEFEEELETQLLEHEPSGIYPQDQTYALEVARRAG